MRYTELLKKIGRNYDPFLLLKKEDTIDENKNFFVIAARAPYTENHLLIIPKKKAHLLKDLNGSEKEEMRELLEKWAKILHKKHESVNLLLRDGLVGGVSGKSINHLHFHLIPDCPIGAENTLNSDERLWLNDQKYIENTDRIKKDFLNGKHN